MKKTQSNVMTQVRNEVKRSGMSQGQISRMIGVTPALLSKVMHQERSLSIGALERLAAVLNLEIILRRRKGKAGR